MATHTRQESGRPPLSKERIFEAAVATADQGGLEALTMRGLAEALDVEAMSLYYHVANKEALLDGVARVIVEEVLEGIADFPPATGPGDWRPAIRSRILQAREVMLRHKWAPQILETRAAMNPAVLRYFHELLKIFRSGGLSYDLIHHALHALGSRALGFSQELFNPGTQGADQDPSDDLMARMASELPVFIEFIQAIAHDDPADRTLGWCDDQTEFEFALDLMLDGIDRMKDG